MAKTDDGINQASATEMEQMKQQLLDEINCLQKSNNLLQVQCLLSRSEFIALDIDYRIVSYTDGSTCLFKLLPEDRGREITSIVNTIKSFDISPMLQTCISQQKTVSEQVVDFSGSRFSISVTPYLSHDHCIGGCVICIDKFATSDNPDIKSMYIQPPNNHAVVLPPNDRLSFRYEASGNEGLDSNYLSLFVDSPVGYLVLRRDGSIKFANHTIARMLGTTDLNMIGKSFMQYVEIKCRDNFLRSIWRGWLDQATDSCEIKLKHHKKSFDAICHILAKRNSDNQLELRLNISDISAIKHREKREKTFFAIAGHELRTPLTNIKLALDMARQKTVSDSPEAIRSFIDVAHRAATRLQNLADSMLDYNLAVSGSLKIENRRTDLIVLIQDIISYHDLDPIRKTAFNFDSPEQEVWINTDPDRLYQVIVNLLRNAARHSPENCPVSIEIEQTGKWVRVSVIDLGPGVDDTIRNDLFEPFIQAANHALEDETNKGSHGLGLSISRSIIELLGGRIGYRRTDREETCFYFEVPVN